MFRWLERLGGASAVRGAKCAAEGTYEAIKNAIVVAQVRSAEEVEQQVLIALGNRRSWKRTGDRSFECTYRGKTCSIEVPTPFVAAAFFRDAVRAEVDVFFGGITDAANLAKLQKVAGDELDRLFTRDGIR